MHQTRKTGPLTVKVHKAKGKASSTESMQHKRETSATDFLHVTLFGNGQMCAN